MTPATDEHRLVIEHLTKKYGDRTVVDDLSFTVEPGRVTGFLGPNGSGKSTTMKILLDLATADHGTATIGGSRYRDLPTPADTVGAMLEPNAFHPGRSGRNHLRIVAQASGHPIAEVDDALAAVDLQPEAARRRVGTYSLGMKQRLSLAAALLGDPAVLVLDEPANGLDPVGMREVRDLLRGLAAEGRTVFVSSHILAEIEQTCDRVAILTRGRCITHGTVDEVMSATGHQASMLVKVDDLAEGQQVLREAGLQTELAEDSLRVALDPSAAGDVTRLLAAAGHWVTELRPDRISLEDVFLELTSEEHQEEEHQADKEVAA